MLPYALMDSVQDAAIWVVYAAVHRHGFNSAEGCWTSVKTLATETGVHREGVRRALSWLVENGWLQSEKKLGYTTVFRVRSDAPTPTGSSTPTESGTGGGCAESGIGGVPNPAQGGVPYPVQGGVPDPVHEQEPFKQEPNNKNPLTKTPNKGGRSEKDPFRLKRLPSDAVPVDLLGCADLIAEFWGCKKGTRSERVFNRICNKLKQWTPEQRQDALERAIAAGWGDVFEPRPQAAYSASQGRDRVWTSEEWAALDNVNLF